MAKNVIDKFVNQRLKFARKLDKDKNIVITVNDKVGVLYSVTKELDSSENTFYKARILIDQTYIAGRGDKKLEAIIEALKHMELQGNTIMEYMK
tara:strand:- start:1844 stop:2125 length:282 start_codon:yes stop_codon:yes gene_type:complete